MSNFNNMNMYSPHPSPWTSFLNKEPHQDPYALYKDSVSLILEQDVLKIQNQLMLAHKEYTKDVALKVAICIMMERMLALQNEHTPNSLDSMVMALFLEMPSLQAFRNEFVQKAKYEAVRNKKRGFFKRLFGLY